MKHLKLDIKAKFGVLIAVVLGAVALCGWSGIHSTNGLNGHVKTLYNRDFAGMRTIADLNVQLGHVQDEAVNYTLTGEKSEATELEGRAKVIRDEIAQLAGRSDNTPKEKKLLTQEASLWNGFTSDWNAGKFAAKGGRTQGDVAGMLDERMDPLKTNMETLSTIANASAKSGFKGAESLASSGNRLTLIMVAIAALLGLAGTVWLIREIVPRVRRYSDFTTQVAGGDLSSRVEVGGNDELTHLGDNLNTMVESLAGMSSQVLEGARAISASASEILATASQQSAGANQQSAAINETTTATEEIRATAEQTARTAEQVAERAQQSVRHGDEGAEAVHAIVEGMAEIRHRVEGIAEDVQALSERTAQIGEITNAVNDLADQSNLLALNATIEAARAGEQGKGFAVVADEVRNLAEQSKQATAQVQSILEEIERATRAAVSAAQQGTEVVEHGTHLAERAGEIIAQLAEASGVAAQSAEQISASVQQQNAGMDQIARGMQETSQATGEFVAGVQQSQTAAEGLNAVAGQLQELASQYKV
ncbi:MAG TPA: methyl-accepting chemotaxis protein [Thermoleophilaceae bacterium]